MTRPDLESVETIFQSAAELPEVERVAYLDRACAGDATLRQEVESLLRHLGRGESQLIATLGPLAAVGPLDADLRPARIGPYALGRVLGEGGCGVVYEAEQDPPLRRRVAIKVIKLGMDTREVVSRFQAERQTLALMDHPNVAHVYDAGATPGGRPYFVMELVDGVAVTRYCDRERLGVRERLRLFVQVCRAVQHAHSKGIIHRDIKASNVLVTVAGSEPVPKVIDFGIARAIEWRSTGFTLVTEQGGVLGTPEYMSPEQATGQSLDTRADVYSLGVLLYEVLVGELPFAPQALRTGSPADMARMISEVEPARPSTRLARSPHSAQWARARNADLPLLLRQLRGDLDWIVMRCLEKDRERRYPTPDALAADVERFLADQPVSARPAGVAYRAHKFVRRNRALVGAATGVTVALLAGIAGTGWALSRERDARRAESRALEEATTRLRESYIQQARAQRRSGRVGQRLDSLELLGKAAAIRPAEELRDELIACLSLHDLRIQKRWSEAYEPANVAFDTSLSRRAVSDDQGNIQVRSIEDNGVVAHLPGAGTPVTHMHFANAGGVLLASYHKQDEYEGRLQLWDLRDARSLLPNTLSVWGLAVDISRDGQFIAAGQSDGFVRVYEARSGAELHRLRAASPARRLAFDPQARRLAVALTDPPNIEVINLATSPSFATVVLPLHDQSRALAWSPDGCLLAVGGDDCRVHVFETVGGREYATMAGHAASVARLAFAQDGMRIVSGSWDGTMRIWDCASGEQLVFTEGAWFQLQSDGTGIAFGEGVNWAIAEVVSGPEVRTVSVLEPPREIACSVLSCDGRYIAAASRTDVRVWNAADGRLLHVELVNAPHSVFFEPTGRWLYCTGSEGMHRWALETSSNDLRLGNRETIWRDVSLSDGCLSADGQCIAAAAEGRILLAYASDPHRTRGLAIGPHAHYLALSPDHRWIGAGKWAADGVSVWDVDAARLVHEFPTPRSAKVAFSPDSRLLAARSIDELSIWSLADGRCIGAIRRDLGRHSGAIAFSPDGRILAFQRSSFDVQLVGVPGMQPLATFESPIRQLVRSLAFSPDGAQLLIGMDRNHIHMWDLRAVNSRLTAVGLPAAFDGFP